MTDDWQKIVEFVRSNVASDVYLNRCLVKARVDGKVVRLSSPGDFTEEAFDGLIRALVAVASGFAARAGNCDAVIGFFDPDARDALSRQYRAGTGQTLGLAPSTAGEPSLPGERWSS